MRPAFPEHRYAVTLLKKRKTQCEIRKGPFMTSISLLSPQPFIRVELIMPPDIILIVVVGCSAGLLLLLIFAFVMFKVSVTSRMNEERFPVSKHYTQTDPPETKSLFPIMAWILLFFVNLSESPLTRTFWNRIYYLGLGNNLF